MMGDGTTQILLASFSFAKSIGKGNSFFSYILLLLDWNLWMDVWDWYLHSWKRWGFGEIICKIMDTCTLTPTLTTTWGKKMLIINLQKSHSSNYGAVDVSVNCFYKPFVLWIADLSHFPQERQATRREHKTMMTMLLPWKKTKINVNLSQNWKLDTSDFCAAFFKWCFWKKILSKFRAGDCEKGYIES